MLLHLLKELTAHFENDPNSPSLVDNLPHAYLDQHMKSIIAFEIAVTDITHVFKLSQNRDEVSRNSIIEHLSSSENKEANMVAEEMKKHYHVPSNGHT
jgi:transcriptional regulator